MGKALIIAEKPSLANKIINAIGIMKKEKDYSENQNYIVTSVFGHLLTLYDIEDYTGEEKQSWTLDNLPFFPKEFKYKVKNDKGIKARYKLIKDLINRNDVTEIINAGDSDREGEVLINIVIYKIFQELKISKTIKRIWLEDQTENTIRKELKYVRDIKNTENLYNEGLARSYIDWLYGINLTRYISIKAGTKLNTGRVIIPTVKYIYDRDLEIRNFKPEKYYEIPVIINKDGKDIKLNFKDLRFNKDEKEKAKQFLNSLKFPEIQVEKIESKEVKRSPKKLFSLATLQNYMSKKYKISLDKTLSLVQSLYEKGYLTYPRTNTEYMAEEEISKAESIIESLKKSGFNDIEIKKTKSIFDSSKVESHSALTPTEKIADVTKLTDDEKKVYEAVKNRFLANFCIENCITLNTSVTFKLNEMKTKITGTAIKQRGYLKYEDDLGEKSIPAFKENEILPGRATLEEKQTTPPSKVTEAELNKFFEKPFKKIDLDEKEEEINDEEDYKDLLKGIEIGTPATRSGTVEKVKEIGYIKAEKNVLSITPLGERFIETLEKLHINLYKEKTVELSKKLKQIYNEELEIDDVLKESEKEIKDIINQNIKIEKIETNSNNKKESLRNCPICGKEIFENSKAYSCSGYKEGCKFVIWKNSFGKKITKTIAKDLLKNGQTKKINGFKSKTGKEYSAILIIKEDGTVGLKF